MAEKVAEEIELATLAEAILSAGRMAHTEEDLRMGVEQALAPVRLALGITPRYETSYSKSVAVLGGGSSDAVYGHAVIEYKKPGVLSTKRGVKEAIWGRTDRTRKRRGGLVQYMQGEASRYRGDHEKALRRIIGIGMDGERVFFLRYRGGKEAEIEREPEVPREQLALFELPEVQEGFHWSEPYKITEESVGLLLVYLRALRRRPLTPEALADEFGPKGDIARQLVAVLYERLLDALTKPENPYPKAATFFAEWDRIFGIVYGQDISKARKDASKLAKLYGLSGTEELKPLLFAVHTYYALLMKLLAIELVSLQTGSFVSSIVAELGGLPDRELHEQLAGIEDGGLFASLGIRNFLEGDFFGWYLTAWESNLAQSIREMVRALSDYEPATGSLQPETTRDLLKKLYQYLIPRELRHDLGEYYTPDWLAELVLNELGYDGNLHHRLLDPACGSGTFLVLAIRRAQEFAESELIEPRETVDGILANIVGFDLNPLAVIAARTNYLLALGNLIRSKTPLDIPVYLCDSILTPAQEPEKRPLKHAQDVPVPSVVGEFWIPVEVVENHQIEVLTTVLEECVRHKYSADDFLERCRRQLSLEEGISENSLATLYEKVVGLEREGKNGIWARIIKNAFAPVFVGRFDYVAGNPPWVNWESLADDYREATTEMWRRYGLFSLKGHAARLGGGKKDVAMLMLYAAMDSYLKDDGKLGFVITQTVFKTKGAGDGFRRFRLGEAGTHLKVLSTHDLVELQPFEGASNNTATVVLQKGQRTQYPVSYTLWRKTKPGRIAVDLSLAEVEERTKTVALAAQPVNTGESRSPWLTAKASALDTIRKVVGPSVYKAHAGACTWLNGAYWLRILEHRGDGLLLVENLHDVGKIKLPRVQALIEAEFVHPLLRGRDVGRWRSGASAYTLMVQDPKTRTGYDESWLKVTLPHTYAYLKQFEAQLRRRSGYKKFFAPEKDPFYAMYDISEYTFASNKVVWREQASELTASAVLSEDKATIPDHKLMLVECETADEAYYLAACLNCVVARLAVKCYVVAIGMSTHILENIAIPRFDPSDPIHQSLSSLSKRAHDMAVADKQAEAELRQVEKEIAQQAARLWGITKKELTEVRQALAELA